MRDRALTAFALALMLGSGCGRGATRGTGIALAPCQLTHPSAAASAPARCGTLEVPEDWRRPSGRRLSLRVAVIPSESGSPTPDALFFLAGGPGQAATEQYPVVASALAGARRGRDVVLVDQRGTDGSGPLTCATPEGAAGAAPEDEVQRLGACARQLTASGTDLAHYGTLDFVRDLEAVRAALGYPRVDLIAVSYGTRAALGWLRAHPERIRALVLDGVVAPGVAMGASAAADARRALELHLRRCRADTACRARFPGLEARSADLLLRLARAPARLSIPDPLLGTPRAVELGPAQARRVGELLAYAPETAALWPLLVERAAAGDLVPLAAQALLLGGDVAAEVSLPLQYAVLCGEDVPFYPPKGDGDAEGELARAALRAGCAAFPGVPPRPELRASVRSDVPALLLSGEADPVTPPAWAELAAADLPRARHLVLPGGGHGVLWRGCVPQLVARFLDGADAAGLDASCLERSKPSPFFLDAAGPGP
jgi:pimeloyl-ACP methyl ester carboxylesterase